MRIVFQGDSITDADRERPIGYGLGEGYPKYAAQLLRENSFGQEFELINMGNGGDRTCDLLARWQTDCIDLQPDILSILVGVNDTWRRYDSNDPTTVEEYERNYRRLLEDARAHTKAKIIMLEPFLVDRPEKPFREDLDPKIDATRRLARLYADVFVPLDGMMAAACLKTDPNELSVDGVHPGPAGARLIARAYVDALATLF